MDLTLLRPDRTDWTSSAAYDWCLTLARRHYENFPVASLVIPHNLRPHVAAFYAFARIADDIADEPGLTGDERIAHLEEWSSSLNESFNGNPIHPVFVALRDTIREYALPRAAFTDLLSAFRQDVIKDHYETFEELLDYCSRSANPVGRVMLRFFGHHDEHMDALSDAICTALQLTNFWQDFSQDLARGRMYLPLQDLDQYGIPRDVTALGAYEREFRSLISFEVGRTRTLFENGKPLLNMPKSRFSLQLRLTWHGGIRVLDKITRTGYNVLHFRPKLVGIDAAVIAYRALLHR